MSTRRLSSVLALGGVAAALLSLSLVLGMTVLGGATPPAASVTVLRPGAPAEADTVSDPVVPSAPSLICTNPLTPTWTGVCLFLPAAYRRWPPLPPLPGIPALQDPSNPDGDGTYDVLWDAAADAETYVLEEALGDDFAGAVQVYAGPDTAVEVSGRGPTRYFYRVKARNGRGDSAWSSAQDVDVLWEMEPNNEAVGEANGPVVSGLTYFGTLPDVGDYKDYYFFDLGVTGSVEVWLTNIASGNNYELVLRDSSLTPPVAQSTKPGNQEEHILVDSLPPGRYYVQVVRVDGPGSSQPYHVRQDYP